MEIKALNAQNTQRFAETVCFDYNPVHKVANTPQYVPGDYLFLKYVEEFVLSKGQSLTFKGKGVTPEEKLTFENNEIRGENIQVKFQLIDEVKIENVYSLENPYFKYNDNSKALSEFFPNFDHKTFEFVRQYCLISADLVGSENLKGGVLKQILDKENLQRTQNSLFVYRSSSFSLNSNFHKINLWENLTRNLIGVETSMTRGIFKIGVIYKLFNQQTLLSVADLKKEVVCYNLESK